MSDGGKDCSFLLISRFKVAPPEHVTRFRVCASSRNVVLNNLHMSSMLKSLCMSVYFEFYWPSVEKYQMCSATSPNPHSRHRYFEFYMNSKDGAGQQVVCSLQKTRRVCLLCVCKFRQTTQGLLAWAVNFCVVYRWRLWERSLCTSGTFLQMTNQ